MTSSHAKPEIYLESPTGIEADDLLDAWRDVLGKALSDERDRWEDERRLFTAQVDAAFSKLQAEFVTRQLDLIDRFTTKLGEIRNGDVGPLGPLGPMGPPGERGEKGDAGEKGETGEQGETGSGEPGPAGEKGEVGSQGVQGPQGERGEVGPIGKAGPVGPPGERGERGERGLQGEIGVGGPAGPRGEAGPQGPVGMFKSVRLYVPNAVNYGGEVVAHAGATYQACRDTVHAPPHEDWTCLASRGDNAVTPKIMGTFHPEHDYDYLNIVALNGSSFVAKCDKPGPCPGDGWQVIASAGRQGKPGIKGDRGEQGPSGLRGERGSDAPIIVTWYVDVGRYAITPIYSDKTEGEPLIIRGMFEQFLAETR